MEKAEESNIEALIRSFSEITSATRDEAQFFLESHNFDLDSAVSTFFDNSAANAVAATPVGLQPVRPVSPDSPPSSSPARSDSSQRSRSVSPPRSPYRLRSRQEKQMGSSSRGADKGMKKSGEKKAGGIRTLADLNRSGKDESDSDSDEPQEYFTGGEKSGMMVQDPTRGRDVDTIFDQARQAGGAPSQGNSTRPSSSSRSFTGTGRLLSGDAVAAAPAQGHDQQPEPLNHTIYFWRNGFSIDDGPLRRMDDPQNAPFLESIMKSECPKELEPADRKTPVHVSLVRKGEEYTEPEKPKLPFQGVGRTLGSSSSSSSDVPVSQPASSATPLHAAPAPSAGMVIDQNAPLTSIQIRLADGTRMVSRFNYHHTIGDIRAFINASRPGTSTTYQLHSMGFPPKPLLDPSQTIEQAGLANSVVIQRF